MVLQTASAAGTEFVPQWRAIGLTVAGTAVGATALGALLYVVGKRQVRSAYAPFKRASAEARRAAQARLGSLEKQQDLKYARAMRHRDNEVQVVKNKYAVPFRSVRLRLVDGKVALAPREG